MPAPRPGELTGPRPRQARTRQRAAWTSGLHGGEPETDIVSVILVARATGHDLEEKVAEYTAKAARAGGPGDASLGMLWHKLSELPVVTIAKIRGRGRRDAPRRGRRAAPGPAAGTGRALEAILGADDFDAETAERYGWVNRALPDADLDTFVARLARRIASYPADAVRTAKRVLNELTMPARPRSAPTPAGSTSW